MGDAGAEDTYQIDLNDPASTLSQYQLMKLGQKVCETTELVMLAHNLGMNNKCDQIQLSKYPGYELLRIWSKQSGTSLKVLRTNFQELKRGDLVDLLDELRYDYMRLIIVFIISGKNHDEVLDVPARKPLLHVLRPLIETKYDTQIPKTSQFILSVDGYESLDGVPCSLFKGKQLNVIVHEDSASLETKKPKYEMDDLVSTLPTSCLIDLGSKIEDSCIKLAHLMGLNDQLSEIQSSENSGHKLLSIWSEKANTTFRVLVSNFKHIKRDDLLQQLDNLRYDYINLKISLNFEDNVLVVDERTPSQTLLYDVIKHLACNKYNFKFDDRFIIKINGCDHLENVKCEDFKRKDVVDACIIKSNRKSPTDLSCFYHGSRKDSEKLLREKAASTGTCLLRYQEDWLKANKPIKPRYALSVAVLQGSNVETIHLIIEEKIDANTGESRYSVTENGFEAPTIEDLLKHYSKNKATAKNVVFLMTPLETDSLPA